MTRHRARRALLHASMAFTFLPCAFGCGETAVEPSQPHAVRLVQLGTQLGPTDTLHQRSLSLLIRTRGVLVRRAEGVIT